MHRANTWDLQRGASVLQVFLKEYNDWIKHVECFEAKSRSTKKTNGRNPGEGTKTLSRLPKLYITMQLVELSSGK